jgi:hypothetical protein
MATGLGAGLVKGLFSPVSAFMPDAFNEQLDLWEEDSTRKALGMMARSQYKTTYDASPTMKGVLANAPGTVGDIGGMLIPFAGTYEAARSAFKVGEAATLTAKMARTMMAAGSTGGLLSAAAKLDPGESRWGKIATDSVAMGAFEMVGIPAMLKAWKEESPSLAKGLLAKTGMESKELEAQLTAVRAGVPADEKVLDAVLNHAKGNPELEQTPIVLQAAKQKEAKRKLTQPKTVLDPLLASEDVTHAAQVKVTVGDQPPTTVNITRDPGNPQHFTNQVNGLRTQLKTLTDQGVDIKVTDVVSGNAEDANEVLKALQGKTVKPPNPDKAKRKVPGAAPPASVAENGDVPVVGDKVTVAEPDKPLQQGVVASKALADVRDQRVTNIGPPPGVTDRRMDELVQKFGGTQTVESAPPVSATAPPPLKATGRASRKADAVAMAAEQSTVRVTMPDATMRDVPLAQIQTPLTVGVKQSMTLKPHLDGSDRHAIIHLNDNLISFEGRGASKDPGSNYFRSELFPNTNPDAPFGQDPRLFIHNDGGLTISVNKLEGQADLVTQKRAAKLLIDHGVSADTPVAVASAITEHSPGLASDKGRLRDLATAELPLANMSKLSEDAANRGLTATPFGDKVTLKSRNGFSRTFANSLEAHEAVLRMPLAENNVKVEAELEKAWKMGSERAWDPDVDVTKYVPLAQQEQGLTEVAQGKRPLTPVYTTDGEALTSTIRQLEKNMGVPENTFRVQFLPAMDDVKRKAAVIYNNDAVALARRRTVPRSPISG